MIKAGDVDSVETALNNGTKPAPTTRGDVVNIVPARTGLTRSQADHFIKAYEEIIILSLRWWRSAPQWFRNI